MKPTVGIHENVVLQKVLVSDKGRLMVFLRSKGEGQEKKEENPFEQMNASEVIEESSDTGITFWPFKAPEPKDRKSGQDRTPEEMGKIANGDVQQMKNQFQQILEQYMTKDQITWSVFDGTGMDKDNYWEQIYNQPVLDIIYKNLCEQFIGMITPYLDKDESAVRFKLVRQSKEKHFARVPSMFIKDNPFIESMDVPADKSRVKWTKYEEKEGLNDGTPLSRETADATEAEPEEGENAFGSR
jgi:hypothetical protein